MTTARRQRAFTLLEVLVALAILAIALGAVISAAGQGVSTIARLRDQTLATWVARNQVNQVLLARDWPGTGQNQGTAEMAGREWHWTLAISETPNEDIRRLDLEVRARPRDETPLALLVAYKDRPSAPP